jgi:hypothetical protein
MSAPTKRPKALKRPAPLALPDIDISEAAAIKALNSGTATAEQQKRALDWIIKKGCMIGGISMADDSLKTAFNEGKRFVGANLLFIVAEPIASFD